MPDRLLEEAIRLFAGPCGWPPEHANALGNLALVRLGQGRPDAARALLDEARQVLPEPESRTGAYQDAPSTGARGQPLALPGIFKDKREGRFFTNRQL